MTPSEQRSWVLRRDPSEIPRIRRDVAAFLREHDAIEAVRHPDVELVVSELVTNALLHGDSGQRRPIEVEVRLGEGVEVWVRDAGYGMRPGRNGSSTGGLGLAIVMAVSDGLDVRDVEGATEVTATFEPGADS